MRDLSLNVSQNPKHISFAEVIRINGGLPDRTPLKYREIDKGAKRHVTFEFEPVCGPAVLYVPQGNVKGVKIFVSDEGKVAAISKFHVTDEVEKGYVCLCMDARGTGELTGINQRHLTIWARRLPSRRRGTLCARRRRWGTYSAHVEVIAKGARHKPGRVVCRVDGAKTGARDRL